MKKNDVRLFFNQWGLITKKQNSKNAWIEYCSGKAMKVYEIKTSRGQVYNLEYNDDDFLENISDNANRKIIYTYQSKLLREVLDE